MLKPHLVTVLASLTVCGAAASPATAGGPVNWSGFGTLGAVWHSADDVFFNHPANARDAQRVRYLSQDTVLGLQGTLALNDRTDLTLQLQLSENHRSDYKPELAWAYLRHDLRPDLSVRLGRLRAPFFMHSDVLNVNYAHPWVRPPVEVYGLNPVNELSGADLLLSTQVGAVDVELQPYLGTGTARFPGGRGTLKRVVGISTNLSKNGMRMQLSHAEARFDLSYGDIVYEMARDALLATGQESVLTRLSGKEGRASFSTIGVQWHLDRLLLTGEVARRGADRYLSSAIGWHLTAAYQMGAFTPYLTIAELNVTKPVLGSSPAPAFLSGYLHSRSTDQRSVSLGNRWDFAPNRALKVQWSRVWVARDAWGAFFPSDQSGTTVPSGRRIDMLNLSLDFTF